MIKKLSQYFKFNGNTKVLLLKLLFGFSFVIKAGVLQYDTREPYICTIVLDYIIRIVYNGRYGIGFQLKRI